MSIFSGTASTSWDFSRSVRFAVACVVLCPLIAHGEPPESSNNAQNVDEIHKLIRELGATQFVARENATKQLFQMGIGEDAEIALKEITRASQESDREVSERAKRILDLVKARVRDEGLKDFLAGKDIENVPGWKRFSKTYGTSDVSRSVFTMILKEEWELLATCIEKDTAADSDKGEGKSAVAAPQVANRQTAINVRYAEVMNGYQHGWRNIPLGTVLAFYLIGEATPESFNRNTEFFSMMLSHPMLRQNLVGTPRDNKQKIIRQIVGNWMLTTIKYNSAHDTQALTTAMTNRMADETKVLAAHILKNPDSSVVAKRSAMEKLAFLRDTNGIEFIEPYLTDKTLLSPRLKKLQLRDIALTCLMDLHGHDVAEIGVERMASYGNPYVLASLGFENEEQRQEAFNLFEELQDEKARKKREAEKKKLREPAK